jgi:transcriptional regulator with XRE-family HTH domain
MEETLGTRLQAAMRRAKLKNPAVAGALGVNPGTVSAWRGDAFPPTEEKIEKLAALLDVETAWLRYGDRGPSVRERTVSPEGLYAARKARQMLLKEEYQPASGTFAEHVLVTAGRIIELAEQMAASAAKQQMIGLDLGRRAEAELPKPAPISPQRAIEGRVALKAAQRGSARGKKAG